MSLGDGLVGHSELLVGVYVSVLPTSDRDGSEGPLLKRNRPLGGGDNSFLGSQSVSFVEVESESSSWSQLGNSCGDHPNLISESLLE